jgi:acetyl esterase/lipase
MFVHYGGHLGRRILLWQQNCADEVSLLVVTETRKGVRKNRGTCGEGFDVRAEMGNVALSEAAPKPHPNRMSPFRTPRLLVALLLPVGALAQPQPEVIQLWVGGAPGFENRKDIPEESKDYWVRNINSPSVTVFPAPKERANGCAVVVAPGGGLRELVFNAEGRQTAEFLNTLGITAFVLKYRLPKEENSPYTLANVRQDAYRAIRLVRNRASEFNIDPKRVGILGFSAGGAVVSEVAFDKGDGDPRATDPIDRENGRPNFEMMVYPGTDIPKFIPADTPPAFLIAATDDDYGCDKVALEFYEKFRAANVPVEAHFIVRGRHGFNMGDHSQYAAIRGWPQRLADWLGDSGFLMPAWSLPGSATHSQVPPPADYHLPSRTFDAPIGVFEGQADVGSSTVMSSATIDAGTGRYTIHSAGYNIWYTRDEFRYLWKRMSGDVSMAADIAYPDPEGYGDRKVVLVIRQNLDDDAKEVMTALHGAGLIHLAQRPEKGANIRETYRLQGTVPPGGAAQRIGIEKHGDSFALFVGSAGEPLHQVGPSASLHMDGPFYVGIGFCSHVPNTSDTAVVSNVVLENADGRVR